MSSAPIKYSIKIEENFEEVLETGRSRSFTLRKIPKQLEDIVHLEDRAAYRSLGRGTALMLNCIQKIGVDECFRGISREELGIYIASPPRIVPIDIWRKPGNAEISVFDFIKKNGSPKGLLKEGPGMSSAQIGIYLRSNGPALGVSHYRNAVLQAFERATLDFKAGRVKRALFGVAFSPGDILALEQTFPNQNVFEEFAAAVLFEDPLEIRKYIKKHPFEDWSRGHASVFNDEA